MTEPTLDPAASLALARATRASLATRATAPWYAPLYGLGCGAMIAAHALPPHLALITSVIAFLAVMSLYHYWTQASGLRVNGYRAGRTLPITLLLLAAFVVIGGGALILRYREGLTWAPLAGGALLAPIAGVASHWWDRVWLSEMRDGL